MARYTGPKRKLSRREGLPLFSKDEKYLERKGAMPPGQRGTRRTRRLSEYGLQLREKQKAKRLFGILERQFKNYYLKAAKKRGETGLIFLRFLETRLDNIVFKLGFSKSRMEARQMVAHGHILLDGKKNKIPSSLIKINSVVAIAPKFVDNIQVKKILEENVTLPSWLDRKATVGKVLKMPEREEMEQSINEQLLVEYYSR